MTTLQIETLDECGNEAMPLLEAHYREIATDKAVKPLEINWEGYFDLEAAGVLRIMTARADVKQHYTTTGEPVLNPDGTPFTRPGHLIGYFVSIISPNLHYSKTRIAMNDIYYVAPEHRGTTLGYRLLKAAAEDLKNLGADILTVHMKVAHPFRNLLIKQGFTLTEENWDKVL